MTTFNDRLESMQNAQSFADRAYVDALAGPRSEYVQVGQAHVENETVWLGAFTDVNAQTRAQESWDAVVAAREALLAAIATADTARTATLTAAWNTIKNDEPWSPPVEED